MKETKLIIEVQDNKYIVELWIAGSKSEVDRSFKTKQEALNEVKRIMTGLSLPSNALIIKV